MVVEEEKTTWEKCWLFGESPFTWGAIGVLLGAIGVLVSLKILFVIAGVVFAFGILRVRFFEGGRFAVQVFGNGALIVLITLSLIYLYRVVPKPKEPKDPPTALEIAEQVAKLRDAGSNAKPPVIRTTRKPEVQLIFKATPLFTPERKTRITKEIDDLYRCLVGIGFSPEQAIPPLGTASVEMMSGIYPGPIYGKHIAFPEKDIDHADAVRRVYADYVFRNMFHEFDGAILGMNMKFTHEVSTIFSVYYTASCADVKPPDQKWVGRNWVNALWEVRKKEGKDFADRALFYTYKTWQNPTDDDKDFDKFFGTRFLAGVFVLDNRGEHLNDVVALLRDNGTLQQ